MEEVGILKASMTKALMTKSTRSARMTERTASAVARSHPDGDRRPPPPMGWEGRSLLEASSPAPAGPPASEQEGSCDWLMDLDPAAEPESKVQVLRTSGRLWPVGPGHGNRRPVAESPCRSTLPVPVPFPSGSAPKTQSRRPMPAPFQNGGRDHITPPVPAHTCRSSCTGWSGAYPGPGPSQRRSNRAPGASEEERHAPPDP